MNDLTTISRLVLAEDFTLAGAIEKLTPDEIRQAMHDILNQPSLAKLDPKLSGEDAAKLADHLRPLGAKIAPQLSEGQATAWRMAMLLALSDLPPRVAHIAARKAIHRPMQFLNEVETVIREFAEEAIQRQRLAYWRLKLMLEEIGRSGQPKLEAPPPVIWTPEMVDEANAMFRQIGADTRYTFVEGGTVETNWKAVEEANRERRGNVQVAPEQEAPYTGDGASEAPSETQ